MEATVKSNNNRRRRSYHTKRSSSPVGRNSGRVFAAQPVNKNQSDKTETKSYPFNPNGNEKLRIIPLGGQEEVGRNMTVFEYAGDIVILDMGIQFPEEDMPGIDYIIPNTKYLIGKEKNIKGVIFSHGHLDHIGAAPILLEKLGNPVIAGRDLTLAMIKHKMEDYKKGSASTLKIVQIKGIHDVIRMGRFTIKFFQVEHSKFYEHLVS